MTSTVIIYLTNLTFYNSIIFESDFKLSVTTDKTIKECELYKSFGN